MVQRTALFAATLVAAIALAVGLVFAGVGPGAVPAVPAAEPVAVTDAPPQPTVQVDTVYLAPKAEPEVITLTREVKGASHDDEGDEHEGDDD